MNAPGGPTRGWTIRRILTWLAASLAVSGLAWGAWGFLRPLPSLDEAALLAEAGEFDTAESRVRSYLARNPAADAAHLLLAQLILKRPDPPSTPADVRSPTSGRVALEHLGRVRPTNPRMAVALHLARGRALDRLMRLDEAEAAWLEALKIDPTAPEAGWDLLNLYYLQGREEEARSLALRLVRVEPDPHDRVLLLLELVKFDARPPAARSLLQWFEPVVRDHPGDLHSALALGLALSRAGQVEKGIDLLRRTVQTYPDRVEAWDWLLTALDESGQVDVMEDELERVPKSLSDSPRLYKHRARVAHGSRWQEAVELYRRAQQVEPYNRVVEYRLSRALRHVGEKDEAEQIDSRVRARDVAIQAIRPLYDEATAIPDLGVRPQPTLYQKIAEVREQMQMADEARLWHRLVLGEDPKNEASLAALARLEARSARR